MQFTIQDKKITIPNEQKIFLLIVKEKVSLNI